MTDLNELLKRVKAATGPDRELDFLIQIHVAQPLTGDEGYSLQNVMDDFHLLGPEGMTIDAPYTASIDAALALVERVLPGWGVYFRRDKEACGAGCLLPESFRVTPGHAEGATLPLAILAALLHAVSQEQK